MLTSFAALTSATHDFSGMQSNILATAGGALIDSANRTPMAPDAALFISAANDALGTTGSTGSQTFAAAAQSESVTAVPPPPAYHIFGTSGADALDTGDHIGGIIASNAGNDTITLRLGDWTVDAGSGNDKVKGANGSYTIKLGSGDDVAKLGNGDNVIDGGSGSNTITVGNGDNTIKAGTLWSRVQTGTGNNDVTSGSGGGYFSLGLKTVHYNYSYTDEKGNLITVKGSYTDSGAGGNNIFHGGSGSDYVVDHGGDSVLHGGAGSDYLQGGYGADALDGGQGDDTLVFGNGDTLNMKSGNDIAVLDMQQWVTGDVYFKGVHTGSVIDLSGLHQFGLTTDEINHDVSVHGKNVVIDDDALGLHMVLHGAAAATIQTEYTKG